ncbi:MAG: zinc ribbon domain-containing protein [Chitinophagaceae bacterium]|nr:zinc ribbon domain-containing protein [Chitinophagaceae bacterium]
MEANNCCQSCSMPLDKPELLGTEKDGKKNNEYCVYCYQNGAFTNPNITLAEMKILVKQQMEKMKMEQSVINRAVDSLPGLKRWRLPKTAL